MIKYFDRVRYNTETANFVCSWTNGRSNSDFFFEGQEVYTTKKGQWFIYAYGGAMSRWSVTSGNETSGGGDLWLITPEEALKWMMDHRAEDAIAEYSSDVVEDA